MYKKILITTDGSRYSRNAVKEALRTAKFCKSQIVVLSVVNVNEEFEALASGLEDKMIKKAEKIVANVKKQASKIGVKVEVLVRTGEAFEAIVDTAAKKKVDLIVMGSHGRTGLKRLLMGSVTSRVIGHAPCKVLVVQC